MNNIELTFLVKKINQKCLTGNYLQRKSLYLYMETIVKNYVELAKKAISDRKKEEKKFSGNLTEKELLAKALKTRSKK